MFSDKNIKWILLILGGALLILFFLIEPITGGDFQSYGVWRFNAMKLHLMSELSFPYFTPTRCGGFTLFGDAHDLSFTPYMLVSFLIPNVYWAAKITNFLLSILLWMGVYRWLAIFNIASRNARLFSGLLVTISGYWLYHLTLGGHIWGAGLAYTPWILLLIEKFFQEKPRYRRDYALLWIYLVVLSFLLINSGYYWLQVALPLIALRVAVELLLSKDKILCFWQLAVMGAAGAGAILLSLPRFAAIYEFQLSSFPRLGGEIPHFQIIGDTKLLVEMLLRSLFDSNLVIHVVRSEKLLGFMWDYNTFIGLCAIVPIVLSFRRWPNAFRSKAFVALLLAMVFQLAIIRTTHVADFVRSVFPLFKSITWYWRGNAILVLGISVLVAFGYEYLLQHKKKALVVCAVLLMVVNLSEILYANRKMPTPTDEHPISEILTPYMPPAKPLCVNGPCNLDNIYGYGNTYPSVLSIKKMDVSDEPVAGYYNMHDVRQLAGPQAKGGYYLTHPWPLWPRADKEEFEKFINYKQVVTIPPYLKLINTASGIGWIIFIVFWVLTVRRLKRS